MKNGISINRKDFGIYSFRDDIVEIWTITGVYETMRDLHRTNGPALMYSDYPCNSWYINGSRMINNTQYQKYAELSDEDMSIIVLKYGDVK